MEKNKGEPGQVLSQLDSLARIAKQIEIEAALLEDAARMRAMWKARFGKYERTPSGVSTYDMRQMFNARGDIDDLERQMSQKMISLQTAELKL